MNGEFFIYDVDEANQLLDVMRSCNASLELAAKAMSQRCHLRRSGYCDQECLGRILCDATDLVIIQELQDSITRRPGPPPDPSCLEPTD